ncbi:carcinoembryonic antigen-related cell adhesion molecule 21-like [Monodelphis domestica]|uniref:carcinoembryonic antigen-related cell adhesion molecule 21-like n=1 Tax=Monodelphis domestica TaxID=13616 RepID=UPI0024E25E98|nr:carcinoembryonic antigen-related cell adhesion molecule 21-like [Monodelphis domestica]
MVPHNEQHRLWEKFSEAPYSGGNPWKWLLITASILSCWSQPTSAQDLTVVPIPANVKEGDRVILVVQGVSGKPLSYTWFSRSPGDSSDTEIVRYIVGNRTRIPVNIRQKVLPNGSLLIPNLLISDTKYYTVQMVDTFGNILRGGAPLTVYGKCCPTHGPRSCSNSLSLSGVRLLPTLLSQGAGRSPSLTHSHRKEPEEGRLPELRASSFRANGFPNGVTFILLNLTSSLDFAYTEARCTFSPDIMNMETAFGRGIVQQRSNGRFPGMFEWEPQPEKLAKPMIAVNDTNILEDESLILTCSTENVGPNIRWFFNDQPLSLHRRMSTFENNQILLIKGVKREDSGSYQCEAWNPANTNRSDDLTLTVSCE